MGSRAGWQGWSLCIAAAASVVFAGCTADDPTQVPTGPAAPSNLTAQAVSNDRIDLTWTDNATDETGFVIQRCTGADCFGTALLVQVTNLEANRMSYSFIDLAIYGEERTHTFRIQARNAGGSSAFSNTAVATTLAAPPPAPSDLTALAISSSRIDLTWTDNATDETGFLIERAADAGPFAEVATVAANVTTYQNTSGLAASTAYTYRVRSTRAGSHSAYTATATATTFAATTTLDAWLLQRPAIAAALVWEDATGAKSYIAWSAALKSELEQYLTAALSGGVSLTDPPANLLAGVLADDEFPWTVLDAVAAKQLYLASVGHSLALEYSGALPWSLLSYSAADLTLLLDGRSFFRWRNEWRPGIGGYGPVMTASGLVLRYALPAPPAVSYRFLEDHGIVAATKVETLARLFDWARGMMNHFPGPFTAKNHEDTWQYRGLAPVSRILSGTLAALNPPAGVRSWAPGCHGTNTFLMALLRAVNIPVRYVTAGGHATPFFSSEGLYLDHGDDLYTAYVRIKTAGQPIPASEYFITQTTWDNWFGAAVPYATAQANIDRRMGELTVQYLPDYLLWRRCEDIRLGLSDATSSVYTGSLDRWYTLADLYAQNLWTRLDAKIASLGGCSGIPAM